MKFLRYYALATTAVCALAGAGLFELARRDGPRWLFLVVWLYGSFSLMISMAPAVRHPEEWQREDH